MAERIDIRQFLEEYRKIPVIDVRSPAEYLHGHIPGAINLPLFTDEERAIVGKTYHLRGREEAVKEGLKAVGPKMKHFVDTVLTHAPGKQILVYCWRGGMRSSSIAFLAETAGMKARVLEKGYKAYRQQVLQHFSTPYSLIVLGGMTGSGKTEILQLLREKGEQVIDLEGLANHKGSAFGHLGLPEQPSTEYFENLLYECLQDIDPDKHCWIEDESFKIGKISLPMPFYLQLRSAPVIMLQMPRPLRAARLVNEYPGEPSGLIEAVTGIYKRLGHKRKGEILSLLNEGNLLDAALALLEYYDKTYQFGQSQRTISKILPVPTGSQSPEHNAELVYHAFKNLSKQE
ncbi:MAG: tRNA 2-selenouridine(34) synthase MnmH [Bacteroidales bacterium]